MQVLRVLSGLHKCWCSSPRFHVGAVALTFQSNGPARRAAQAAHFCMVVMKIWFPGNLNGTFKSRWHTLSPGAFRGLLNNLAARERKALSGPRRARWRQRRLAEVELYRALYGDAEILEKFSARHCVPRFPPWFPPRKPRRYSRA